MSLGLSYIESVELAFKMLNNPCDPARKANLKELSKRFKDLAGEYEIRFINKPIEEILNSSNHPCKINFATVIQMFNIWTFLFLWIKLLKRLEFSPDDIAELIVIRLKEAMPILFSDCIFDMTEEKRAIYFARLSIAFYALSRIDGCTEEEFELFTKKYFKKKI